MYGALSLISNLHLPISLFCCFIECPNIAHPLSFYSPMFICHSHSFIVCNGLTCHCQIQLIEFVHSFLSIRSNPTSSVHLLFSLCNCRFNESLKCCVPICICQSHFLYCFAACSNIIHLPSALLSHVHLPL